MKINSCYSEQIIAEAVKELNKLRAENEKLKAMIDELADRFNAQSICAEEFAKMSFENAELRQAVGLMTTAKSDMLMDVGNPIGMAREVVEYITSLRDENAELNKDLAYRERRSCRFGR